MTRHDLPNDNTMLDQNCPERYDLESENEPSNSNIRDRLLSYLEFIVVGVVIFGSLLNWTFPVMPMTPEAPIIIDNDVLLDIIKLELIALFILFAAFGAGFTWGSLIVRF